MRKESLNIAVACFIGGMLGVLFAVKIAEMYEFGRYLWFMGAFVGGAIAYLAYDPLAFASAMRRAWRELADVEHAKRFLSDAIATVEIVFLIAVIVAGVSFTFFGGNIGKSMHLWGEDVIGLWFTAAMGLLLLGALGIMVFLEKEPALAKIKGQAGQKNTISTPVSFRIGLRYTVLFLNPICLPLLLVVGALFSVWTIMATLAQLLWHVPKAAWLLAVFAAEFIRLVFVYIHSTARVVCFVDTALGVAVAYTLVSETLGAMLAGGAFGLVFGVLNYELISVRWLHLIPARVKK